MIEASTMVGSGIGMRREVVVECGWERLELVEVTVLDARGERVVAEPHFAPAGQEPCREPLSVAALSELMAAAGFQEFVSFIDADAIARSRARCDCGAALEARGFRRDDPRSYRAFAVCAGCGRVHFEF